MKVTVYEMEHSPFCIPVTHALTALGIEFERIAVSNWNRALVIEATKGKYYQVPVLQHDDSIIYESSPDSQEIANYLDQNFAGGRLLPDKNRGLQEILIRYIEDEIELVTFKLVDSKYLEAIEDPVARTMTIRHKERKFGPGCVERWRGERELLREQAEALLRPFERTLQHSPFILGDEPFYVDFSLFGVIGNYEYRGYNALPDEFTALREWRDRLAAFSFS